MSSQARAALATSRWPQRVPGQLVWANLIVGDHRVCLSIFQTPSIHSITVGLSVGAGVSHISPAWLHQAAGTEPCV